MRKTIDIRGLTAACSVAALALALIPAPATAQDVTRQLAPQPDIVTLPTSVGAAAPGYVFSATRADGEIVFSGAVPNAGLERYLVVNAGGASRDEMTVKPGAPEGFADDVQHGLDALLALQSGRLGFEGGHWTLAGVAASDDDAKRAQRALKAVETSDWSVSITGASGVTVVAGGAGAAEPATAMAAQDTTTGEGTTAGEGAASPVSKPTNEAASATASAKPAPQAGSSSASPAPPTPAADKETATDAATGIASKPAPGVNYTWSANLRADGAVVLSGMVPDAGIEHDLVGRAGGKAEDDMTVAAGAPDNFVGGALAGLDALMRLGEGELSFAGGRWSLGGRAKSESDISLLRADLGKSVDLSNWSLALKAEPPAEPAAPQMTTPPSEPSTIATAPAAAKSAAPTPMRTPAASAPAAPAAHYTFSAVRDADGAITLSGDVPADAAKRFFAVVAGGAKTDGLSIVPNAPEGFTTSAVAGLEALKGLSQGTLAFSDGGWSLTGKAASATDAAAAKSSVAALPDGKRWSVDITGPSPLELCQAAVAGIARANAITFAPGSTRVAPSSRPEIESVAKQLAACPDTKVEVEGHTDSDGDAKSNLALSVARAEAVVAALIDEGLDARRLYAIGYGESKPLVPNDSAADKARNRRIGFTVLPE